MSIVLNNVYSSIEERESQQISIKKIIKRIKVMLSFLIFCLISLSSRRTKILSLKLSHNVHKHHVSNFPRYKEQNESKNTKKTPSESLRN